MDLLDISCETGDGEGIPDVNHVDIMFEAMKDSVAGNEGLTEAQVYAGGVLQANGYHMPVDGNESMFDSVANGAKAVYDYILRMFKSVWSFFFGREVEKQMQSAKTEIKSLEVKLQGLNSGSASVVEFDQALHRVKSNVTHFEDIPAHDQATFDQFVTQADEAIKSNSVSDKKKAVANLLNVLPGISKTAQKKFRNAATVLVDLSKKFVSVVSTARTEVKEGIDGEVRQLAEVIVADVNKYVPHANQSVVALERHDQVQSVNDAVGLHRQLQTDIEANRQLVNSIKSHTSKLNQEIKFYEGLQKEDVRGKHTSAHLEVLHGILRFSTIVAQYLKRSLDAQVRLANCVNAVFGV